MTRDKEALDALHRLALKKVSPNLSDQLNRALFDFFKKHQRMPKNAELQRFIQHSSDPDKYSLVTDDNWSRHVKISGVGAMFRRSKKA